MIKSINSSLKIVPNAKKNKWIKQGNLSFGILFFELSKNTYTYSFDDYPQIYDALEMEGFDDKFVDIYENSKISINNKIYDIQQIYLKSMSNGEVHYIDANNTNIDLLTGLEIKEEESITRLMDSSIFYEMYLKKLITSRNIVINSSVLQQYADSWNGFTHIESPDLYVSYIINNSKYKNLNGINKNDLAFINISIFQNNNELQYAYPLMKITKKDKIIVLLLKDIQSKFNKENIIVAEKVENQYLIPISDIELLNEVNYLVNYYF